MAFTDVHSHILPAVDDGSRSVEESIEMLRMSKASGVGRMIATPHFYPHENDPERFLEKRNAAAKALSEAVKDGSMQGELPLVGLGAEVAFFKGISRSSAIKELRILGTDLLLIEMPFERWSGAVLDEILSVKTTLGLTPIIAHVERYFDLQTKGVLAELFAGDVLIQVNAESFVERKTAKKVLSAFKKGNVDLLGSDCHDTSHRAPNFEGAVSVIEKKLGRGVLEDLMEFSAEAFVGAESIF